MASKRPAASRSLRSGKVAPVIPPDLASQGQPIEFEKPIPDDPNSLFVPILDGKFLLSRPFVEDFLPLEPSKSNIPPQWTERQRREMEQLEDKVFVKDGVRYLPLSDAARIAKTPPQTMLSWIKNETEFDGQPLDSLYFKPLDSYFVGEDSIQKAANRFVKWPSNEPASDVVIGQTEDQTGYIGTSEAAKIVGVSSRTIWLWAKESKAPLDRPLDVIRCKTSDEVYILEKDVADLAKLIPKSGLQRGRRPQQQLSLQP